MYKITLLYESNEIGIYTKEEETSDSFDWTNKKVFRMLQKWIQILNVDITSLPILHLNNDDSSKYKNDIIKLLKELIDIQIKLLNLEDLHFPNKNLQPRTFSINVEEII